MGYHEGLSKASFSCVVAAGLAASLALSGCSMNSYDGPKRDDAIRDCFHSATNVEPTYVKTDPGYSEATDPNKLIPLDKAKSLKDEDDHYGIGDLVCKFETHSGTFTGSDYKLVLTQRAIDLSQ